MCGRHSLRAPPERIATIFHLAAEPDWKPRYNVAPSQQVLAVVRPTRSAPLVARLLRWGLIPRWATDASFGNHTINAQSETVATKPAFRDAFRRRRCLVISDGFYEWQAREGRRQKQAYYISRADAEPFAFAGLWDTWHSPVGEVVDSCTVLTTVPNQLMEPIHRRMPVILPPEAHAPWLDPDIESPELLQPLIKPYEGRDLVAIPVSSWVNSPAHEGPACIQPVAADPQLDLFQG